MRKLFIHLPYFFQQVCQQLSLNSDNTWIGATDEHHEGLWINLDGSDYVMAWAAKSEPNNGMISQGEQNCMALRSVRVTSEGEENNDITDEDDEEDLWNYGPSDIACDAISSNGFICEQPGVFNPELVLSKRFYPLF